MSVLSRYKGSIQVAVENVIASNRRLMMTKFLGGLELLKIDMPIDCITQSGVLDTIEDEHMKMIMKRWWAMIEAFDQESVALQDELESL